MPVGPPESVTIWSAAPGSGCWRAPSRSWNVLPSLIRASCAWCSSLPALVTVRLTCPAGIVLGTVNEYSCVVTATAPAAPLPDAAADPLADAPAEPLAPPLAAAEVDADAATLAGAEDDVVAGVHAASSSATAPTESGRINPKRCIPTSAMSPAKNRADGGRATAAFPGRSPPLALTAALQRR